MQKSAPPDRTVRRHTRYAFSAHATIMDEDGDEIPAHVTDISLGGCRLFAIGKFRVGEFIAVRIRSSDEFEATARIAHCSSTDLGVMWESINPQSSFVLQKWIQAAIQNAIEV